MTYNYQLSLSFLQHVLVLCNIILLQQPLLVFSIPALTMSFPAGMQQGVTNSYGVVYNSNIPGNVIKQSYPNSFENNFVEEANLQSIAADLGIAPKVAAIETFPGDVGNRFEMRDVRTNYEPVQSDSKNLFPSDRKINIQTAQCALDRCVVPKIGSVGREHWHASRKCHRCYTDIHVKLYRYC